MKTFKYIEADGDGGYVFIDDEAKGYYPSNYLNSVNITTLKELGFFPDCEVEAYYMKPDDDYSDMLSEHNGSWDELDKSGLIKYNFNT